MAGKRESNITVATGEKGGGKSYQTLWRMIVPYAKGMLNGGMPRRVVIFDPNNEYHYSLNTENNIYPKTEADKKLTAGRPLNIKAIAVEDLPQFSKQNRIEIRRISPFYPYDKFGKKGELIARKNTMMSSADKVDALINTIHNLDNALLVIEDLRTLFGDSIPHDIVSIIVSNRHKNLDIVWHLQSIGRMLPEFWENVNYLRFHKEKGSLEYHRSKLQERFEIFKICDILVKKVVDAGNTRYFVWVVECSKIKGAFTPEMLLWCIEKYIKTQRNYLKELLDERDTQGRTIYTYAQALQIKKTELYNTYNGNTKQT